MLSVTKFDDDYSGRGVMGSGGGLLNIVHYVIITLHNRPIHVTQRKMLVFYASTSLVNGSGGGLLRLT